MLISEFIKQKNEIIYNKTGITLVEPIVTDFDSIEYLPLNLATDTDCCPYCIVINLGCDDCPIVTYGGIQCSYENSNYDKVIKKLESSIRDVPEIQDLVRRFNEEQIQSSN